MKFIYKDISNIEEGSISATVSSLLPYIKHLRAVADKGTYDAPESSINLVSDTELLETVKELAQQKQTKTLKYIVVVGIGGSNLGTQAVYDAVFGELDYLSDRYPKILFADTSNPQKIQQIVEVLLALQNTDEFLINVISKSGGTTETIANFSYLYDKLSSSFEGVQDRIVATTDENSKLWKKAKAENIATLSIPKRVGGRYSVFSAVGLFPLLLAGIDINTLRAGAHDMRDKCLADELLENPALLSAVLTYTHAKNGISINNLFVFNTELESCGRWYRQLMGESIGKEKDTIGNVVRAGITPIVSVGSTDLHSMAQLYIGGPRDKFTSFVYAENTSHDLTVPKGTPFAELVKGVAGNTFSNIMSAIFGGVTKAYQNNAIPFVQVELPDTTARSVGEFLQFKMMEMMYLARLLELNAFDQPNVEDYKEETRQILER